MLGVGGIAVNTIFYICALVYIQQEDDIQDLIKDKS
jgi:hypothetical protein